jgi:hypothetical protein
MVMSINVLKTILFIQMYNQEYKIPISHNVPVNPAWQEQVKWLTRSLQVPLLRQGSLAHSLISENTKLILI